MFFLKKLHYNNDEGHELVSETLLVIQCTVDYLCIDLCEERERESLPNFEKSICMKNGDDKEHTTDKRCSDWFHAMRFNKIFVLFLKDVSIITP